MIKVTNKGSYDNFEKFLGSLQSGDRFGGIYSNLDKYGRLGVDALASATPHETGLTAKSWGYRVNTTNDGASIEWYNTNVNDGVNIAVIIQYGHGTGTGGFVSGIDYINPAIRPIFDQIAADVWEQVKA